MIEKILNHVEIAEKNLMSQYKEGSSNRNSIQFRNLLKIFVKQIQELENTFYDLYTLRYIDTAFGYQLDRLGDIVGIARYGLNDEDYRNRIYAQIILNASNGQPELFIQALRLIMNATNIKYSEYKNQITIFFRSNKCDSFLHSQMLKLCLAGIKKVFLYQDFSDTQFTFAESFLNDFNLVTKSDKIIVDSNNSEYNLLVTSGDKTYVEPRFCFSDTLIIDGEIVKFKGGILKECLNP